MALSLDGVAHLRDPQGLSHRLLLTGGEWLGWENLAHGFEPAERRRVVHAVLKAVTLKQPLPYGFTRE